MKEEEMQELEICRYYIEEEEFDVSGYNIININYSKF